MKKKTKQSPTPTILVRLKRALRPKMDAAIVAYEQARKAMRGNTNPVAIYVALKRPIGTLTEAKVERVKNSLYRVVVGGWMFLVEREDKIRVLLPRKRDVRTAIRHEARRTRKVSYRANRRAYPHTSWKQTQFSTR